MRETKVAKMEKLVKLLKQSTLHKAVEKQLSKAEKALSELVDRSGAGGVAYSKLSNRMAKLKHALKTMPRPVELYTDTQDKMKTILKSKLPPKTSDALGHLANGKPAPKPAPKKAAPKKAAPKKAVKKGRGRK